MYGRAQSEQVSRQVGELGPDYSLLSFPGGFRVLLPTHHRHAAARGLLLFATGRPASQRAGATLLGLAFASGLEPVLAQRRVRLAPPHGLERALAHALDRDLVAAIRLGPAGGDSKPVALLLTPCGGSLGYAKFAVNDHTARLVRAETEALRALHHSHLPDVTVPRLLHSGSWRGMPFLIQEALPVGEQTDAPTRHRLLRGTLQIANTRGIIPQRLHSSEYLHGLVRSVREFNNDPRGGVLRTLLARLPDVTLPFGAWHGDLTRWNMSSTQRRDFVWDWERFQSCAPLGFDALHYNLHERLRAEARTGADAWLRTGARLLRDPILTRAGLPGTCRAASTVMSLYLAERTLRLLRDDPGWRPESWLNPMLVHLMELATRDN